MEIDILDICRHGIHGSNPMNLEDLYSYFVSNLFQNNYHKLDTYCRLMDYKCKMFAVNM